MTDEPRGGIPLEGETEAFRLVCEMEDLVYEISARKTILFCIAAAEGMDDLMQPALSQMARDFGRVHRALEDRRHRLFRLLHPQREALDRQDAERQAEQS